MRPAVHAPGRHDHFPEAVLPKERWDEQLFAQLRAEIDKRLAILDRQLGENEYVVGNRYSLVEVCYAPFVAFLDLIEVTPPPRIAEWSKRILSRPSAQQNGARTVTTLTSMFLLQALPAAGHSLVPPCAAPL